MKKSFKRGIAIVAASAMALSAVMIGNVFNSNADAGSESVLVNNGIERKLDNTNRDTKFSVDSNKTLKIDRKDVSGEHMGKENSWTIFVYLCGSDLESYNGLATMDIKEMIAAGENDNVNIIIQTGGARTWRGNSVSSTEIGRYQIKNDKLQLIEKLPQANMGEEDTLESFLTWGVDNYAAEHMGIVLWNHGGGSLDGACFDEKNSYDSLSLAEMELAMAHTTKKMTDRFDFIGFDACLMASIETANVFAPYADYMIASEESEPGYGWEYTSIVNKLVSNPDLDPEELCKTVVDSYYKSTVATTGNKQTTLSAINLRKLDKVITEFDKVAKNLVEYSSSKQNVSKISFAAKKSENYGGNNSYEGYTNMVDLADFMKNISSYVGGTEAVVNAIDDMMVHELHTNDMPGSNGLTFYYPLQVGSMTEMNKLRNIIVCPQYMNFLDKVVYTSKYTTMDEFTSNNWETNKYFFEANFEFLDYEFTTLSQYTNKLQDTPYFKDATFDDVWNTWYKHKSSNANNVDNGENTNSQNKNMAVVVPSGTNVKLLGNVSEVSGNAKFNGKWFVLNDGQELAAECYRETNGVKYYTAPVVVNGKTTNIRFYVENNKVAVMGTWDGISANGMAAKGMKPIKAGDKIVPLYKTFNTVTGQMTTVKGKVSVASNNAVKLDNISKKYGYSISTVDEYGKVSVSAVIK